MIILPLLYENTKNYYTACRASEPINRINRSGVVWLMPVIDPDGGGRLGQLAQAMFREPSLSSAARFY